MHYSNFFLIKVEAEDMLLFHKNQGGWLIFELLEKVLHGHFVEYWNFFNHNSFMQDKVFVEPLEDKELILLLLIHD